MDILVKTALSFLGLPYRWGGDDTIQGFDCSGLAQEILASVGMDPKGDQTAHRLYYYFLNQKHTKHEKAGSLAFYGSKSKVTHVGFMIDHWRMIEAGGGGSKTKTATDAANQNAFVRIRPVRNRTDLVEIIHPDYKF